MTSRYRCLFIAFLCLLVASVPGQPNRLQYLKAAARLQLPSAGGGGGGGGSPLITSGLVAYWKFDEGSGTTAADVSGNAITETLSGFPSATWDTPYIGAHSLAFGGAAYLISAANATTDPGSGDLTVTAWVKLTDVTDNRAIITKYGAPSGTYYYIAVHNTDGLLAANFQGEHGGPTSLQGTVNLADGSWHFVTVVLASMTVQLYVDGVSDGIAGSATTGPVDPGNEVVIGQLATTGNWFYKGNIDEVGIYSRALTGTEITTLFTQTHP